MSTTRTLIAALAISATLISGCGNDGDTDGTGPGDGAGDGAVTLEVKRDRVEPGRAAIARVVNGSGRELTMGVCPALEVETAPGEFAPARSAPVACIELAAIVAPGESSAPLRVEVPANAEAGRYRLVHQVTLSGDDGEAESLELSAEFDVGT